MAFKFAWLCDLLERLEEDQVKKRLPEAKRRDLDRETIVHWFNLHNANISRSGESAIAFLSCLFPERRVDRVYGLKEKRLSRFLGRALRLGIQRKARFEEDVSNGMDVARCVEKFLREAELPRPKDGHEVTLEEIDNVLDQIAASCQYSTADLKLQVSSSPADRALEPIFLRLQSHEAKWLTRIILKNFSPVFIPNKLCMNEYHFLLYDLLAFQDSFAAALTIMQNPSVAKFSPRQPPELANALKEGLRHCFIPKINLFVRRQPYDKARSIKHCAKLSQGRQMSLERKYDGEYCQVHIKIGGQAPITIFSKSGKVSTMDRVNVHDTLKSGLRLGEQACRISSQCILEGELLVWNDTDRTIQPFRTIRKHVNRSGAFIGIEQDSPRHPDDHLMVVFYDILLWDDVFCTAQPHHQRRRILKSLVNVIPGRIDITERQTIDFRSRRASEKLRLAFANSIAQRWEGLVLKGFNDPYCVLPSSRRGIKLKKDYIKGLGDTEDFVVLGGRYSEQEEYEWQRAGIQTYLDRARMPKLFWTLFHVASLENKTEVSRWNAKPSFRVVGSVSTGCIEKQDLITLNQLGHFSQTSAAGHGYSECFDFTMDQINSPHMTTVFKKPFVVELMGAGFDRPAGVSYPMLRFPRLQKIHEDRSIGDIVGLDELVEKAKSAEPIAEDDHSQEDARWIDLLIRADGRNEYKLDRSQTTTPSRSPTATSTTSMPSCVSTGLIGMKSQPTPAREGSYFVDSTSPCPSSSSRKRKSREHCLGSPIAKKSKGGKTCARPSNHRTTAARRPLTEINNFPLKYCKNHRVGRSSSEEIQTGSEMATNPGSDDQDDEQVSPSLSSDRADTRGQSLTSKPLTEKAVHLSALGMPLIPTTEEVTSSATDQTPKRSMHPLCSQSANASCVFQSSPLSEDLVGVIRSRLKDHAVLVSFPMRNSAMALSVLQMQRQSQASFTSSDRHFVRGCLRFLKSSRSSNPRGRMVTDTTATALHVMLVDEDSMSTGAIARATERLVKAMVGPIRDGMKTRASDAIVRKHALMVMDWQMLSVLHQVDTGQFDVRSATREIQRHFWGAFTWPLHGSGGIGSTWELGTVLSWLTG